MTRNGSYSIYLYPVVQKKVAILKSSTTSEPNKFYLQVNMISKAGRFAYEDDDGMY